MSKYKIFLLVTFLAVWIWAAINPWYPEDWLLENVLVFIFIPLILISGRYFKLSKTSYTLVTMFMILHVIGSHYTYEYVPFGETLGNWFGLERNMYDRLVHFSFGFLLAYPVREVFIRITETKGFWGYYLPIDVTLSFSAVFEIIEWLTTLGVDSAVGIAFLGAQGDVWDAQKDVLMAGFGASLSMLILFTMNWIYTPGFDVELKESLKIEQSVSPEEQKVKEWIQSRKKGGE